MLRIRASLSRSPKKESDGKNDEQKKSSGDDAESDKNSTETKDGEKVGKDGVRRPRQEKLKGDNTEYVYFLIYLS